MAGLAIVDRTDLPKARPRGGVELLASGLAAAADARGVEVVLDPTVDALRVLAAEGPMVVFTQQEGRLSAQYADWAHACLAAGAVVVEKNVFALPSAHRPRHPRYVHGLLSTDGAHRFAWRSAAAGHPAPPTHVILPNPSLLGAPAPRVPGADGVVRLLRVGRDDIVKWSTWEQVLAVRMAQARPDVRVELDLVGVPEACRLDGRLPANLVIRRHPMLDPDGLRHAYAAADGYVHHSRIGETFGNTLAEAQAAGCFCVAGLDPAWDCGPLEFLAAQRSWVGTPGAGLTAAGALVDAIQRDAGSFGPTPIGLDGYLDRLLALAEPDVAALPSTSAALAHLRRTGRRLGGRTGEVRAPAVEAVRAAKNRITHRQGVAR